MMTSLYGWQVKKERSRAPSNHADYSFYSITNFCVREKSNFSSMVDFDIYISQIFADFVSVIWSGNLIENTFIRIFMGENSGLNKWSGKHLLMCHHYSAFSVTSHCPLHVSIKRFLEPYVPLLIN